MSSCRLGWKARLCTTPLVGPCRLASLQRVVSSSPLGITLARAASSPPARASTPAAASAPPSPSPSSRAREGSAQRALVFSRLCCSRSRRSYSTPLMVVSPAFLCSFLARAAVAMFTSSLASSGSLHTAALLAFLPLFFPADRSASSSASSAEPSSPAANGSPTTAAPPSSPPNSDSSSANAAFTSAAVTALRFPEGLVAML
mmetsp:Transcript_43218/g.109402  ORF Transcript_43218/g.109402 Transcript_43218/m.109402 type:complete len:202 (+) Transcript_43218:340-945(+)